jgi:hypothetical protein
MVTVQLEFRTVGHERVIVLFDQIRQILVEVLLRMVRRSRHERLLVLYLGGSAVLPVLLFALVDHTVGHPSVGIYYNTAETYVITLAIVSSQFRQFRNNKPHTINAFLHRGTLPRGHRCPVFR